MNNFLCFFIILSFTQVTLASDVLNKIVVKGNNKTKTSIIINESNLKVGKKIKKEDLVEARRRILNLLILTSVKIKYEKSIATISVTERWTTIPVLKFSSGGGVSELIAGVFDPNIMGRYIESGAQYQRLGDKNSGVAWLKIPRINHDFNFDLQFWKFNRIRVKYLQDRNDPVITNGFTQARDKIYFAFGYRKSYETEFKLFYEYNHDSFLNDLALDNFSNQNVILPNITTFHFIGTSFIFGKVDNDLELFDGHEFKINYKYGLSQSAKNFHEVTLNLINFMKFSNKFNLSTRVFAGYNNTENIQHLFYFGGLDAVRGFADNRFSGKTGFYVNNELRTSVIKKSSYILQLNKFIDVSNTKDKIKDLAKNIALSAGVGFRVVLPKFYRFVIRFDYAKPLLKQDNNAFSFGVQQFF